MKKLSCILTALALSAPAAHAAPDLERGKQIATQGNGKGAIACIGCHGADGMGNAAAGFPRLAGLDAGYLAKQLADYRSGSRQNPVMQPFASALEQSEAAAVAAFYASLKPTATEDAPGGAESGRQLALRGAWEQDIPACVSCHGPGGHGVSSTFPALAGQHASYIRAQLEAWRKGARRNDPNDLMRVVAERMSPEQIQAVSEYFAGLSPAGATKGVANR